LENQVLTVKRKRLQSNIQLENKVFCETTRNVDLF